mmetsp:Transcript_21414/g.50347  ORF Transcript_21414/g.50347 Transcript_21414/m.50347 type:complete len:132 (+) Transcript_21414:114-509(+)
MAAAPTMPVMKGPFDAMRAGTPGLRLSEEARALHPVQAIVESAPAHQWDSKLHEAERVYGTHMGLRLRMERAILSRPTRGPGLPSESLGLDTLTGRDTTFSFEDFLNADPHERAEAPALGLHDIMERRLGL